MKEYPWFKILWKWISLNPDVPISKDLFVYLSSKNIWTVWCGNWGVYRIEKFLNMHSMSQGLFPGHHLYLRFHQWHLCVAISILPGVFNKFPDFFVRAFKIVVDSWKFSILLLYILWDDWPIFYDFSFKWTATAAIGMHPTKAWLSQLVNFKNAIWMWGYFRRTICNKILF